MKINHTLIINAPIDNVFDFVDKDEKIKHWMEGELKTEIQGHMYKDSPVGAKFINKVPGILEWEGEIIAYRKPEIFGVGLKKGNLRGTMFYGFKMLDDNITELKGDLEIGEGTKVQKVLLKTLSPIIEKILDKHLQTIKKLAEKN